LIVETTLFEFDAEANYVKLYAYLQAKIWVADVRNDLILPKIRTEHNIDPRMFKLIQMNGPSTFFSYGTP
jgi:hypothetical protein